MLIKTLCLGAARRDPRTAPVTMRTAARALAAATSGPAQVQLLRAVRHIPGDSVSGDRGHAGAVPGDDAVETVLEVYFDGPQAQAACTGQLAWASFLEQVRSVAPVLFSFDTQSNAAIEPVRASARGGFRRWMLLQRQAATQEQFRDAWFGRHAELVRAIPHIDGYLQNLVTRRHDAQGRGVGYEQLPVDGIAEVCFADEAAMTLAYTSPARIAVRDDGQKLLGRITTILVQGEVLE